MLTDICIKQFWFTKIVHIYTYEDDFNKPKIVWARLMRIAKSDIDAFPRFAAVSEAFMVVDSLCFFSGNHIESICNALNSEFAAYYFLQNVAALDNGGIQMRQQYVEEIPLPIDILHGRDIVSAFKFTETERNFIHTMVEGRKKNILESID